MSPDATARGAPRGRSRRARNTDHFRRRITAAGVVTFLLLSTALVMGASAAPMVRLGGPEDCGTVVTSNAVLEADVGPCNTGHGLVVRGDNIQLNLRGHRVFSTAPLPRNSGTYTDPQTGLEFFSPSEVVGILIDNSTNSTVHNGTVEGFASGVAIEEGGSNTVRDITAQNNQAPCIGEDFSTQAVGKYGDGIVVFASPDNRIQNNTVRRNGPFSGIALVANVEFITRAVPPYPTGNLIHNNLVEDNNLCFADIGIRVEGPGASNNTVSNNTVRRSFQEGIVIHPVNVINFEPLFRGQCQNRGFPRSDLPLCPIQDPLNPGNDNNVVKNNLVAENGFGGAQIPGGPNQTRPPSPQTAAGINVLAFCGYGSLNAKGNVIENNTSTLNAGDGILVGGCRLGNENNPGQFPGSTGNQILHNTAVNNNQAGCGTLPPQPGCGTRPTTQRFDLHDSTNEIVCPSTTPATQRICAGLGFPAPPVGTTAFVGTRVIEPGGTACDNNIWFGNKYGTAFPECTTIGGKVIDSAPPGKVRRATGGPVDKNAGSEGPPPLRGWRNPNS